jgi:hypothetical protein
MYTFKKICFLELLYYQSTEIRLITKSYLLMMVSQNPLFSGIGEKIF